MFLNSVFISTYTFIYKGIHTNNSGPVLPLMNFFKSRAKKVYFLEQPLPGSDFLDIQMSVFDNGEVNEVLKKEFFFARTPGKRLNSNKTYISLKVRDIISNFYCVFKKYKDIKENKIDLFIGLESINAICGILMRKLGLINKVVYYVFDWAPDRYSNPIMNSIYIGLDKIAAYYSDYTWNITYTIAEARKDILGYKEGRMSPQLYVPYCVDFDESRIAPEDKLDYNLVIYSGGLIEENGPMLLLEAYKLVMDKHPRSRLLIIGGGDLEEEMREYIVKNNMGNNVEITGYIADQEKIIDLQRKGAIGVAPYPYIKGSRKPYGDVIKIRMYFSCGLVTVSTPVPPVSREIYAQGLGYRTKDDSPQEIAKGICLFLGNKELFIESREKVVDKARLSDWENNYSAALDKMGLLR